jgi:hypothetical protein
MAIQGRKFTATIRITINRCEPGPSGQIQVTHVRMIEAVGEATSMQAAVEAGFADGVEEFIGGLPAVDGPGLVVPTDGH